MGILWTVGVNRVTSSTGSTCRDLIGQEISPQERGKPEKRRENSVDCEEKTRKDVRIRWISGVNLTTNVDRMHVKWDMTHMDTVSHCIFLTFV